MSKKGILSGKKGLITGVANNMSIAWGIAQSCREQGAELCFTYQSEKLLKRIEPLAKQVGSDFIMECDATDPESLDAAFKSIEEKWGELDFVVHAMAYSDRNELKGRFVDSTKDNFLNSMNISCFSLIEFTKRAEPLMKNGGSIITLSYLGAERVVQNYNVMGVAKAALECSVKYLANDLGSQGIRVNTISAGPIKTLASSAIGGFRSMLDEYEKLTPLRKNVTINEVGDLAAFMVSDLSRSITGENIHADSGFHSMAMSKGGDD